MFWSKKLSDDAGKGATHPLIPPSENVHRNGSRSHPKLLPEGGAHVRFEEEEDSPILTFVDFAVDVILSIVAIFSAVGMATIVILLYLIVIKNQY